MHTFGLAPIALALTTAITMSSPTAPQDVKNPRVVLDTNQGPITIELYQDKAPITVANFLQYVDKGFYDNTVFHRVIGPNPRQPQGFMIQGGGFEAASPIKEKPTEKPIKNEADNGLTNKRGTLAMARTSDPNSATAQFFINLSDNTFLDHAGNAPERFGYAVFGEVVDGMQVVDKIAAVSTGRAPAMARTGGGQLGQAVFDDVPTEPVVIKSATRAK